MVTIIEPLTGYVTVRPIIKTKTESGLYLPEGAQQATALADLPRGEVVNTNKWSAVEVGDIVQFLPRSGYPATQEGETLILLPEDSLLAVERVFEEVE